MLMISLIWLSSFRSPTREDLTDLGSQLGETSLVYERWLNSERFPEISTLPLP